MTAESPLEIIRRRLAAEADMSDPDACHIWPGTQKRGHAVVYASRACIRVATVLLMDVLGRPPLSGMTVYQTCGNLLCANAQHLAERKVGLLPTDPLERISARLLAVDTSDPDACHEWPGGRTKRGYGVISLGSAWTRTGTRNGSVARLLLEESLGRSLLPGMWALHHCDHARCVNIRHLYEGTPEQNRQDAVDRGRTPHGIFHHNAKLTEDQVRAIRLDMRALAEIAAEYGISKANACLVRARKSWAHVPD